MVRQVGVELTSPCTWVKHLPTLLRNKANSQKQPSVYEDRDQKVQRTLRKQKVRGLLQDKKVPGTNAGTRAAAAPGRLCWACSRTPGREPG